MAVIQPQRKPEPVCRIGPNGGPLEAERGIGGTGARLKVADRGIGGTGVVGVVTGFASVCVDGLEIPYTSSSTVTIDGAAADPAKLRVGQVVVIRVGGSVAAPSAESISVRREVAGQITAVQLGTGILTIAGQKVMVPDGSWGATRFSVGDWVAVSGLRRADGVIVASRMDRAPPGLFLVRGPVQHVGDAARVGDLNLGSAAAGLASGEVVTVTGRAETNKPPSVVSLSPDTLLTDPASYFGASVRRLVIEGYVAPSATGILLDGVAVPAGPVLRRLSRRGGLAIVSLDRLRNGSFRAVSMHFTALHFPSQPFLPTPDGPHRDRRRAPLADRIRRGSDPMFAAVPGNAVQLAVALDRRVLAPYSLNAAWTKDASKGVMRVARLAGPSTGAPPDWQHGD